MGIKRQKPRDEWAWIVGQQQGVGGVQFSAGLGSVDLGRGKAGDEESAVTVAVTRNGRNFALWVDGELQTSCQLYCDFQNARAEGKVCVGAGSGDGQQAWAGDVHGCQIFSQVLPEYQVPTWNPRARALR